MLLKKPQQPKPLKPWQSNIDGIERSPDQEEEINQLIHALCSTEEWENCRRYLRSITIERVMGPGFDIGALTHLEGARWLLAIIEKRNRLGEQANAYTATQSTEE